MNEAVRQILATYEIRSVPGLAVGLKGGYAGDRPVGAMAGKFFEGAAFYGGTALRMLYGLDRFSEDLDFHS